MNEEQEKPKVLHMPDPEELARELAQVTSMDDLVGKDGVFARMFGKTLSAMLEGEMSAHLGYEKHEAKGRNSGNSRNGKRRKQVRSSQGATEIEVPRDRQGTFEPQIVRKYATSSNELEDKIIAMYARGMTVGDIMDALQEMYGIETSKETIRHHHRQGHAIGGNLAESPAGITLGDLVAGCHPHQAET